MAHMKHIFNLMHCTFLEGDKMSCHNDLEIIVMYNSNRCIVYVLKKFYIGSIKRSILK